MHCVDLGESFQTHIYLQNLASIQPRTSPLKFAASRDVTGHTVLGVEVNGSAAEAGLLERNPVEVEASQVTC